MSSARTITKYPNRRLYDTEKSRYITLSDIRDLILERVDFAVIDKRSGADITRSILFQVISDLEQNGEPVMSRRFLSLVVQSHGVVPCRMIGEFLERSFEEFVSGQRQAADGGAREDGAAVVDLPSSTGRERAATVGDRAKAS